MWNPIVSARDHCFYLLCLIESGHDKLIHFIHRIFTLTLETIYSFNIVHSYMQTCLNMWVKCSVSVDVKPRAQLSNLIQQLKHI